MRRTVIALFALVSLLTGACADREASPASSAAPAVPPPPAAPLDLAAHGAIAADGWLAVRAALGDVASSWPRSFGALVAGELGLPITVAELVSTDVAVGFVVLAPEGQPTAVVAAFHLRAADRVLLLATGGEGARFRAERDPEGSGRGEVIGLVPVRAGDQPPVHLAIVGNHLVASSSADALRRSAAFVARTPPPATAGVLAMAELGAAAPRLARALTARLAGLAPAMPGLPGASSPGDLAALADGLVGGRVELRVSPTTLDLTVTAKPTLGAAGAALMAAQGPAVPWLALPREATFAALVHVSAPARVTEAAQGADSLSLALGLEDPRRAQFAAALASLALARSPSVAFALGATPEGPAAWFRGGIEDVAAADKALDALVTAAGRSPRRAPGGTVTGRATVIERVGEAVRLRVRVGDDASPEPVDVLVRREDGALLGAAGHDAPAALRALRASGQGSAPSLGDDPLARRVAEVATSHAALLFVDVGAASGSVGAVRPPRAALAASLSLADGPRLTLVAEPRALVLVRAKLASGPP